ncbi:auxin response factor 2-like isoform X2 [Triticum dicoccoides]|uniref:auxin response factor 2-like isoform X2 n=1 Tax=Triticum dicoccoides TaxID=85692 RepID=UPI00188F9400|nr:auxin response factor 2-like isoform X2 [Triticum dicoccoides]
MIGIDLNTVEDEEEGGPSAEPPRGTVCLELWHACAGPVGPLPRKGSAVVYLPEGHLEHTREAVAAVPPHVFCRVVDVNLQVRARARGLLLVLYGVHNVFEVLTERACSLQADPATDEVYAQVSLLVDNEEAKRRMRQGESEEACDGDGEDTGAAKRRARMPHMFCKTLTASDTSTHGGFSVPRRAAEDCFPPLDYNLQRPSQELVAKDLHGTEWRFRHIYRGQPRRHLLTTGWSAFVNKKKLVSGDAVLFLRGEDGVLQLGVRRAAQLKNVSPFPALFNQDSSLRSLGNVAHAVAMKSIFHIYYNPRLCESEFIVPYWKFMRSFSQPFSVGMRFKMKYENEDASERRSTGMITGSRESDLKSHGSKWKCLVVRWDDDVECRRPNRVSPWEIELAGSVSGSHLSSPHSKRLKPCLPQVNPDMLLPSGSVSSDFAESARFHKVLQGQELLGSKAHDGTVNSASEASQASEARNFQYSDDRNCSINMCNIPGVPGLGARTPPENHGFSYHCSGFGESQRFQKVLQGQEVFGPYEGGTLSDAVIRGSSFCQPDGNYTSRATYKWLMSQGCDYRGPVTPAMPQASSPLSVLMFPQTSSKIHGFEYVCRSLDKDDNIRHVTINATQDMGRTSHTLPLWPRLVSGKAVASCAGTKKLPSIGSAEHEPNDKDVHTNGCKIFGISLTQKVRVCDEVECSSANCDF